MKQRYLIAITMGLFFFANQSSAKEIVKNCEYIPLLALVATPKSFEGKTVSVSGLMMYERGVINRIFIDRFSFDNELFENGVVFHPDPHKNIEEASGKVATICGKVELQDKESIYQTPTLKNVEYIRVGMAEWRNGAWSIP